MPRKKFLIMQMQIIKRTEITQYFKDGVLYTPTFHEKLLCELYGYSNLNPILRQVETAEEVVFTVKVKTKKEALTLFNTYLNTHKESLNETHHIKWL